MRTRYIVLVSSLALLALAAACSGDDDATTEPKDAGTDTTAPMAQETGTIVTPPTDAGTCANLLYCEDFEGYSGTVDAGAMLGPWKATVSGVAMSVDATHVYRGQRALHVTTTLPDGGPARGTLRGTTDAGIVPGNDVFGRMMVYYSGATGYGLPLNVHSALFNTDGPSWEDGGKSVNTNIGGGGTQLQINHHFIDRTETALKGGTMTTDTWHCIQWQLDGSGTPAKDENRVWLDGQLVIEAVGPTHSWPSAVPWKTFDFGFLHYQGLAQGDFVDVYIDDFALDDEMIPCP